MYKTRDNETWISTRLGLREDKRRKQQKEYTYLEQMLEVLLINKANLKNKKKMKIKNKTMKIFVIHWDYLPS